MDIDQKVIELQARLEKVEGALAEISEIDDRISKVSKLIQSEDYVKAIAGAIVSLMNKAGAVNPPQVPEADVDKLSVVVGFWNKDTFNGDEDLQIVVQAMDPEPAIVVMMVDEGALKPVTNLSKAVTDKIQQAVGALEGVGPGSVLSAKLMWGA